MSVVSVGIPEELIDAWLRSAGNIGLTLDLQEQILGYVAAAYEEWREENEDA